MNEAIVDLRGRRSSNEKTELVEEREFQAARLSLPGSMSQEKDTEGRKSRKPELRQNVWTRAKEAVLLVDAFLHPLLTRQNLCPEPNELAFPLAPFLPQTAKLPPSPPLAWTFTIPADASSFFSASPSQPTRIETLETIEEAADGRGEEGGTRSSSHLSPRRRCYSWTSDGYSTAVFKGK